MYSLQAVPLWPQRRFACWGAPQTRFCMMVSCSICSFVFENDEQASRTLLCAIKGIGLLPNKQNCGFGYPHALLATTKTEESMASFRHAYSGRYPLQQQAGWCYTELGTFFYVRSVREKIHIPSVTEVSI